MVKYENNFFRKNKTFLKITKSHFFYKNIKFYKRENLRGSFLLNIWNFYKVYKIESLGKILNLEKTHFFLKIEIFVRNGNFDRKWKFWLTIENLRGSFLINTWNFYKFYKNILRSLFRILPNFGIKFGPLNDFSSYHLKA